MRIPVRSLAGALIALGGVAACSVDRAGLGGADAGAGGAAAPDASGTAGAGTGDGAAGRGGTTGVAGASGGAAGTGVAGGGAGVGGGGPGGLGGAGIGGGGAGAAGTGAGLAGSSGGTGIAGSGAGIGGGGAAGTTGIAGGAGTGIAGMGGGGAAGTGMGGGAGTGLTGCNAVTCPLGCCHADGQCITSRTNQTCGNAGAACRACGGCFRCGNLGSCESTPNANWTVICASATIAPLKPNGAVWDTTSDTTPGTWPDALCEMTVDDDDTNETSIVTDSLMPVWDQAVNPNGGPDVTSSLLMSAMNRWVIAVVDRDATVTASDAVCEVMPRLTAQDLERGTVTLSSGSCTQIVLKLVCDEN